MDQETLEKKYEEQIAINDSLNNFASSERKKNKFGNLKKNISKFMAVIVGVSAFGFSAGAGSEFFKYNFTNIEKETTVNREKMDYSQLSQTSGNKTYSNVKEVVEDVKDSVVSIIVESETYSYINGVPRTYESAGSGIIMSEDNENIYIATNNHVITGAKKVYISVDDFNKVTAKFVGSDPTVDLAVISVTKTALETVGIDYKIASFGSAEDLAVGEVAIAMGNALGLGKTATQGIISAIDKTIEVEGSSIEVIQTDAAINPGNSGGALVNSKGLVIGINTAKLSSTSAEGIGYSIPITVAMPILENLISNGNVNKPYIGIEGFGITQEMLEKYSLPSYGIYINGVVSGSGASKGGIRQGDIITEYNGVTITTMDELGEMIDASQVGDTIIIKVVRGTRTGNLEIVLGNLSGESF